MDDRQENLNVTFGSLAALFRHSSLMSASERKPDTGQRRFRVLGFDCLLSLKADVEAGYFRL